MSMIVQAAQLANFAHKGQFRKFSGKPYITHPIRVAGRVATHEEAIEEIVAAAFLHDVLEDCDVSYESIRSQFGSYVAFLVDELTNPPKVPGVNRATRKALDRQRISQISKEAKLIKLIDRIDNLNEIDRNDPFAKVYAEESLLLLEVLDGVDYELFLELRESANNLLRPLDKLQVTLYNG